MATYIKIASNIVGAGGVASVTFSSIPATYTDLILKYSVRGTGAEFRSVPYIYFNGDNSGGNYTYRRLYAVPPGTIGSDSGNPNLLGYVDGANSTANVFGNGEIYIPNYRSSNQKSSSTDNVSENNASDNAGLSLVANLWNGTAAITSFVVSLAVGNIAQYSTFTLYGISNA
jgi:hypothetical protein